VNPYFIPNLGSSRIDKIIKKIKNYKISKYHTVVISDD